MVTPARNVTPVLDAVWRGGGRTGPPKDARRPSAVLSWGKGSSCACVYLNTCDRGQCRSVMCCNENILWVQVWHFLKSKFETFTSSGVYGLWGIDVSGLFQFDQERFRCSSYLPSSKNSLPLGHWWEFRHEKAAVFTKCKELRCWKSFVQREQQINVIKSWKKTDC